MEHFDHCCKNRHLSLLDSMALTLERIVREHGKELRRFALRLTTNRADAEDLVQDALERAVRQAPNGLDSSRLRSWILCVMRNRFLDQCRGRNAQAQAVERLRQEAEPPIYVLSDQPLPLWRQVDMGSVDKAIAQLPPDFRDVLRLSASAASQAQIAALLNLQPGTVRSRLLRARTRVRSLLVPPHGAKTEDRPSTTTA